MSNARRIAAGNAERAEQSRALRAEPLGLLGDEVALGDAHEPEPRINECPAESHGTRTAYWYGCRCPEAREAERLAKALDRRRRYLERGPLSVSSLGTRRRIEGLLWMGWPFYVIDVEIGRSKTFTFRTYSRSPVEVFTSTHRLYVDVFERLAMTRGPSRRTSSLARKRGYAPPLAWDDIDDPLAVPNLGAADRRLDIGEVEWLRRQGYHPFDIAARLGTTPAALEKACQRAGRHDLARRTA